MNADIIGGLIMLVFGLLVCGAVLYFTRKF